MEEQMRDMYQQAKTIVFSQFKWDQNGVLEIWHPERHCHHDDDHMSSRVPVPLIDHI